MQLNPNPHWDALMFSICTERLSRANSKQPGLKYLRIYICEHTTGNRIVIPEYPCKPQNQPTIEELLLFLIEKSKLYVQALHSQSSPHRFLIEHFRLQDLGQGERIFLEMRECFKALVALFKGSGVSITELEAILADSHKDQPLKESKQ